MRGWPPCSSTRERHCQRETLSTWCKERSSSIAQWCSRSYRDCHAVTEYHMVGGRPQLTRQRRSIQIFSAEHVKVKQRAKETQGSRTTQWCWRSYREQRPHTVVLKASVDHAVWQSCKDQTEDSAKRCCKLPDRGVRGHLPRTDDLAVAQYCVVVLEVPEESAEW